MVLSRGVLMKEIQSEHKDDSEFSHAISSLKKAEEEAKETIAKANEGAERELMEAREKAHRIAEEAQDEAVGLKDKLLSENKKGIGEEQAFILKKAEKEAGELERKKLKPEDIRKLAASVLE